MNGVMTRAQLEAECERLLFDPPRAQFDIADVPENLRGLVPYAELWGHNSEDTRVDTVQETPQTLREHLQQVILEPEIQDRFDAWLAGAEAERRPLTAAYLAFTCLRMSADEMG